MGVSKENTTRFKLLMQYLQKNFPTSTFNDHNFSQRSKRLHYLLKNLKVDGEGCYQTFSISGDSPRILLNGTCQEMVTNKEKYLIIQENNIKIANVDYKIL